MPLLEPEAYQAVLPLRCLNCRNDQTLYYGIIIPVIPYMEFEETERYIQDQIHRQKVRIVNRELGCPVCHRLSSFDFIEEPTVSFIRRHLYEH